MTAQQSKLSFASKAKSPKDEDVEEKNETNGQVKDGEEAQPDVKAEADCDIAMVDSEEKATHNGDNESHKDDQPPINASNGGSYIYFDGTISLAMMLT